MALKGEQGLLESPTDLEIYQKKTEKVKNGSDYWNSISDPELGPLISSLQQHMSSVLCQIADILNTNKEVVKKLLDLCPTSTDLM